MQVVVASRHLAAQAFPALDVSGREHLVIAVKATWQIPKPGQRPAPLPPQELAAADAFVGEPGLSAPLYGCDLVRFKPRCDVLFDAAAHAPDGEPVRELIAGFRLGQLKKLVNVHGPRVWRSRLGGYGLSRAEPFLSMPLHFGLGFGGTRQWRQGDRVLSEALLANPDGVGWAGPHTRDDLDGAPGPNLEAPNQAIERPDGDYPPAGLSAVGRHWQQRQRYAGTYDEHWQREVFPFLPEDFDERYHQSAPEDQQIDYPRGREEVVLLNLLKGRSEARFRLPDFGRLPIRVLRADYSTETLEPVIDTLFFETEEGRFSAVWRASLPIRRRIQEIDTVAVGLVDESWWHAKIAGPVGCATCGGAVQLGKQG